MQRFLTSAGRTIGLTAAGLLIATDAVADSLKETIKKNFQSVGSWSGLGSDAANTTVHIADFFGLYLKTALGFGGIIFVVQVLHGGYLWMTAGGNEEQITTAKAKITNAATGVAIVFFAYLITVFALTIIAQQAKIPNTGLQ